jgi:ABC-type transport system involved in cytochrome bd biosynthesis fused ATPase/permease subunit
MVECSQNSLQVLDWNPADLSAHLSFGLQQLICVARAMCAHFVQNTSAPLTMIRCSRASIILADEAAAHVDDETENKISAAFLRAAAQGRTVLSVAHR